MEDDAAWRGFPEPFGYGEVDLARHQVGQLVKPQVGLVGNHCLRCPLFGAAPERKPRQFLVLAPGVIAQPEDAVAPVEPGPCAWWWCWAR